MKIIAGAIEPEGGVITKGKELRSAYLPQNPDFDENLSVMDQAVRYLETISPHFEFYQCQSMLTKLGIADFDQKMGELSGGQRKRVAMAAVLTAESNLLILDEPTNHMDNDIIIWLEEFFDRLPWGYFYDYSRPLFPGQSNRPYRRNRRRQIVQL